MKSEKFATAEVRMKRIKLTIFAIMVGMIFPHTGLAGILPNDLPTIEALIDQHKECMSAEDESNRQLAANEPMPLSRLW